MWDWRATLFSALSALLAGVAGAQVQRPCFVTAVDAVGQPLAGADVCLGWGPVNGAPGSEHVVRARTDQRGRCQPLLVPGRRYSAWCIGAAAEDGSRAVSERCERAACGALLELRCEHRQVPRTVAVDGVAAAAEGAAVELVMLPAMLPSLAERLEVLDGRVALPPAPWSRTWIGLRSAAGVLLQIQPVEPWDDAARVTFEAPDRLALEIVTADGAPAAGITVSQPLRGGWAQTDSVLSGRSAWLFPVPFAADGAMVAAVARPRDGSVTWAVVGATGCAPAYVQVGSPTGDQASTVRVELAAPTRWHAELRGVRADEHVDAQLQVTVRATGSLSVLTELAPVWSEGRLEIELPGSVSRSQLIAQLTPTGGSAPPRVLALPPQSGAEPLHVDLAELRSFTVRVTGVAGQDACGAELGLMFVPPDGPSMFHACCLHTVADLSGRGELVLGDGRWAVYATDGAAHTLVFVAPEQASGELLLQLEPIPTMDCRVVDAEGAPVAGARLEPHQSRRSGFSGVLRGPEGWAKEAWAAAVAHALATGARSDADGRLRVPVQDWRPWQAGFRVRAGARVSAPLQIALAVDLGDVVVR
ncbi:MAG TPA: hypothetical protein VFZ65_06055 [Planctomycetota bacterium]|nr:hypothetical protein [Planctomycetota bacterium]